MVIENIALVAPAETVTVAGTRAAALVLLSATTAPPAGAAEFNVTVPREDCSPRTEAGDSVSDCTTLVGVVAAPNRTL